MSKERAENLSEQCSRNNGRREAEDEWSRYLQQMSKRSQVIKAGGKVILLRVTEASRRVMKVWNGDRMMELTGGSKEGFQAPGGSS